MVSRYKFYSFKIVFSPLPFVWINMTKLDLVLELSIQPPLMVWVTWPIDHLWTCLAPPPFDFDWCNKAFSKLALFRRPWWRAWQKDWQMSSYLPSLAPCPCIHSAYPSIYVDKYFWVRSSNHSASLVFAQPLIRWAFHLYSGLTIPVPAAHFTPTRPSVGRYATWGARPARGNLIMILEALDMNDTIG